MRSFEAEGAENCKRIHGTENVSAKALDKIRDEFAYYAKYKYEGEHKEGSQEVFKIKNYISTTWMFQNRC